MLKHPELSQHRILSKLTVNSSDDSAPFTFDLIEYKALSNCKINNLHQPANGIHEKENWHLLLPCRQLELPDSTTQAAWSDVRVLPLDQSTALTFMLSIKGLFHLQSSSGNTERGIVHGGTSEQPRPGVLSLRPCYFTPLSSLCRTFPPGLSASSCQKQDGEKIQARLFVSRRSDSTCSVRSCGLATGCVFTAQRAFLLVILSTVGLEERRARVRAKYECLDS